MEATIMGYIGIIGYILGLYTHKSSRVANVPTNDSLMSSTLISADHGARQLEVLGNHVANGSEPSVDEMKLREIGCPRKQLPS